MSSLRATLLGLLAIFATNAQAECPSAPVKLRRIEFNRAGLLSAKDLARGLPLSVGKPFTCEDVEAAKKILLQREIFSDVESTVTADDRSGEVSFLLKARRALSSISLSGIGAMSKRKAEQALSMRSGSLYDESLIKAAAARLEKRYRTLGYPRAQVQWQAEDDGDTGVILAFNVNENEPLRIEQVTFSEEVPEELLTQFESEIKDWLGKPASTEAIQEFTKSLLRLARVGSYLQSSIRLEQVREIPESTGGHVEFQARFREPMRIVLEGNSALSRGDLMRPLALRSRSVPIMLGALPSLVRSIEGFYEKEGYCDADAKLERVEPEVYGDDNKPRTAVTISIKEGEQCRIDAIRLEGNESYPTSELEELLETEPTDFLHWRDGFLEKERLASDVSRIENFYLQHGYEDVTVKSEIQRDAENSGRIGIVFRITEGAQQKAKSVQLRWVGFATSEAERVGKLIAETAGIREGDPLEPGKLEEERSRLLSVLQKSGYPHSSVELNYDLPTGSVEYTVRPGIFTRIDKISTAGNLFVHDSVLLKNLKVQSGEPWDVTAIEDSESTIAQLGLFQSVRVEPTDGALDSPSEDLTIRVNERPAGKVDLGSTFNTEEGLRLFGEAAQRNLTGYGDSISATLDTYYRTSGSILDAGRASARYRFPHPFNLEGEFSSEAFLQTAIETNRQFSFDRYGISTSYRSPLGEHLSAVLGVLAYQERLFDVDSDVVISERDQGSQFFSFLTSELRYDRRDNQYNPRSGYLSLLQLRYGGAPTGSEVNLVGGTAQHSIFNALSSSLVWANNFKGSIIEALGDTEAVPISQRFFLGGQSSLRGFSRNVVGPRGELLHIVGGDSAAQWNSELRYNITESLLGIGFIDIGQAFLREKGTFKGDGLSFSDLRLSPGFGIGYLTPVGPLVAQYGFATDREFGERIGRFYLGFGGNF